MNETGRRKRQTKGLLAFAAAILAMAVLSVTEAAAGPRCSNYTWNRSCPRYPADLSKRAAEARLEAQAQQFCRKYPDLCELWSDTKRSKTADEVFDPGNRDVLRLAIQPPRN